MLALGSLYDAFTAQRRPSMGLRYGLNLPCMESRMSRCRFASLPFCGIWLCPTKVLRPHTTDSIFVNKFQIWTQKFETTSDPDTGQRLGHLYSLSFVFCDPWGRIQSFWSPQGNSQLSSIALASLYLPVDAHCTNVPSVYCTSAPIVSPSALKCVRNPSLGGWGVHLPRWLLLSGLCWIIIPIDFIHIVISLFICQVNICKGYTHTKELLW